MTQVLLILASIAAGILFLVVSILLISSTVKPTDFYTDYRDKRRRPF